MKNSIMKFPEGRSLTEKYFLDLIKKATSNEKDALHLYIYVHDTYGEDEWWEELLGVSEKDILRNMKDVFNNIVREAFK